jgi:hypothetical protein
MDNTYTNIRQDVIQQGEVVFMALPKSLISMLQTSDISPSMKSMVASEASHLFGTCMLMTRITVLVWIINGRPFLVREVDWSAGLDSYEMNAVREMHHILVMLS